MYLFLTFLVVSKSHLNIVNIVVRRVFLLVLLFLWSGVLCLLHSQPRDVRLNLTSSSTTLSKLIESVEKQSDITFSYSKERVPLNKEIVLKQSSYSISDLMDEISKDLSLNYKIKNNIRVLLIGVQPNRRTRRVTKSKVYTGFIIDGISGEPLIGATVSNERRSRGVISNEIGLFRFEPSQGEDSLLISHIGYSAQKLAFSDVATQNFIIKLSPNIEFDEILIQSPNSRKLETESNFNYYFSKNQLSEGFGFLGSDPLNKVMQLSGIQSGREGQKNIYVRGGSPDQNLMLMDGVPLYETSHVFGFTSIFNVNAIKNVQVFKHAYPAKYGGRLSSVIDFKMNDGNVNEYKSSIGISPISINLNVEGPIIKGKTSFNISARKSIVNTFFNEPIEQLLGFDNSDFSFYDVNVKLCHQIDENNKISANYYRGEDNLEIYQSESFMSNADALNRRSYDKLNWGNQLFSVQWHNNLSDRVYSKFSAYASDYQYNARSAFEFRNNNTAVEEANALDISATSRIIDFGLNSEFQFFLNNSLDITFGTGLYHHRYNPTLKQSQIFLDGNQQDFANDAPFISANEFFAFGESKWRMTDRLTLQTGLRYTSFYVRQEQYHSLQPRLTLIQKIGDHQLLTVSATKMTQFVHLLVNPGIGLPSELWIPSTENLPPENAYQAAIAYGGNIGKSYKFEIAAYFKKMNNVVEYTTPFDLFHTFLNFSDIEIKFDTNRDWENFVQSGDSESKGVELSLQKIRGDFLFDMTYVIGKTDRSFVGLNNGKPFPYRYDRTHDFSIAATYFISDRINLHTNWVAGTGDAYTLADVKNRSLEGEVFLSASSRNNERLDAYHRLDIGVQAIKKMEKANLTLDLSIFNVYNRRNVYYTYSFRNSTLDNSFQLEKVSLFPIMPHFSINLEF